MTHKSLINEIAKDEKTSKYMLISLKKKGLNSNNCEINKDLMLRNPEVSKLINDKPLNYPLIYKKEKDVILKNDGETIEKRCLHSSPANKEWVNSVYTYNKNYSKPLLTTNNVITNLLTSYFNLTHLINGKKTVINKLMRKKLSLNKVFVSKPEVKVTNDKINITVYIYNRNKKTLLLSLKKLMYSKFGHRLRYYKRIFSKNLANKKGIVSAFFKKSLKYYNDKIHGYKKNFKWLDKINKNKRGIINKKPNINKRGIINKKFNKNKRGIINKKARYKRFKRRIIIIKNIRKINKINRIKNIKRGLILLNKINVFKNNHIKSLGDFISNENDKLIYNNLMLSSYTNKPQKNLDKHSLTLLTNFLNLKFNNVILYLYYHKILALNNNKFKNWFLLGLKKSLSQLFNKKVELNIVNQKYFYLNSDIFMKTIATRLKNRSNRLLVEMKRALRKIKLPKLAGKRSLSKTIYGKSLLNKKINLLLKKDIFKAIKHKHINGIKIKAAGRLSKRLTAARSVSKFKTKGNLKHFNHINAVRAFKTFHSRVSKLKGYINPNLQYTNLNTKTRNGSFGLKGWVNSN